MDGIKALLKQFNLRNTTQGFNIQINMNHFNAES